MFWRIISAAIVLFWAVMTGLIIRDAYFPDSSQFSVVPPKMVFEVFLSQAASFNNQLHLYHEREKIGHAHIAISRDKDEEGPPVYALVVSGSVMPPGEGSPLSATAYQIHAELENGDQWRSVELETRTSALKTVGKVAWKRGDKMPQIEVKKDDEVVLNSEIVQTMMALNGGGMGALGGGGEFSWLSQLAGAGGSGDAAGGFRLEAREVLMDLAGKSRRCYIVSAKVLEMYEMKMYFTEVGELARIELPGGYRFIEPMMHGLEPEFNTME